MRARLVSLLVLVTAIAVISLTSRSASSQPYYASGQPAAATAIVPYYASVFNPGAGQSAEDAKQIIALLKSIDTRLSHLEAKSGAGPVTVPLTKLDPFAVASTKCINCHTPGASDAKGGGFILFATDDPVQAFKPLSARDKAKIKEAVQNGFMPPPRTKITLSADEKKAFDW